jgi:hypothetical protein
LYPTNTRIYFVLSLSRILASDEVSMNFPFVTYQEQKIFQVSPCILSRAENCLGFPPSPTNIRIRLVFSPFSTNSRTLFGSPPYPNNSRS